MKNNKRKKDKRVKVSLFAPWRFFGYLFVAAFIATCSFTLFFEGWRYPEGEIVILNETIKYRAISTFLNILFLCICFTLFDTIKKKITVERPVTRILEATHRITKGDFSVRIKPFHRRAQRNEFDAIIEDFNKMAQELSGIETLKTDFAANVSHEIKTPLAVIQNYAQILSSTDLSEEDRLHYAESIIEASQRLNELISSILKLSKLENQQIFPDTKPYNLSEQLCECLLIFEEQWEKKSIEIETDFDENITVNADSELLMLVWVNLLSNAVKFTSEGGKISVSLTLKNKNYAQVIVADTGCGMTAETGKHIFEWFYQGDTSSATRGNGLGLALVKRVMDITKGEITVASEVGRGTAFTVVLPLK